MDTKLVRISTVAEGIALKYSSSVSKGIIEMDSRIGNYMVNPVLTTPKQTWIEKSNAALSTTGDVKIGEMSEKEFWKKMNTTISSSLDPMIGKGY